MFPLRFCLRSCLFLYGAALLAIVASHFPYATDPQTSTGRTNRSAENFYVHAYAPAKPLSKEEQEREDLYVRSVRASAEAVNIQGMVGSFAAAYGLEDKRILEVGAGSGYLQDIVRDYTGLDIAPTARRYFHKPFVAASATAMPFRDGEFDAIWTIWVLEHIPNPESALREMRRVVRPGGLILLSPAWFCNSWASDGYAVRPYGDFGIGGKLVKASIPVRSSPLFKLLSILPVRALRYAGSTLGTGPTAFHYRRLTANYEHYWVADSDAVNSMDPYEAVLWFESRGDRCLNCPSGMKRLTRTPAALVLRIGGGTSAVSQTFPGNNPRR